MRNSLWCAALPVLSSVVDGAEFWAAICPNNRWRASSCSWVKGCYETGELASTTWISTPFPVWFPVCWFAMDALASFHYMVWFFAFVTRPSPIPHRLVMCGSGMYTTVGTGGKQRRRRQGQRRRRWWNGRSPSLTSRDFLHVELQRRPRGVLVVILSPRCGHEPSSRDGSRPRRNLNTRLVSTISLKCVSSATHFQSWDSNKSSYCESLVSALKYVVTVSSPWRTSWSKPSTLNN